MNNMKGIVWKVIEGSNKIVVYRTAFRRKSNIGPVGPTANHQQGWWFVTLYYGGFYSNAQR